MEDEESSSKVPEGEIIGISFALSTKNEICTASVSEGPINHVSQLSNPFLGLPLEFGKCEACGATESDKCEEMDLKGHTRLKPGQIIHRMTMDGDTVFINRPPTTHKHSLEALKVYVHEDNTVKINPLICSPLGTDFDGDCIHIFYPQSLGAKAEAMELFSVENQFLSSHTGQLNLQLGSDAMLCLRVMLERVYLQQLAMYGSVSLPPPALRKFRESGPAWTAFQLLQLALPNNLSCKGDKFMIDKGEILSLDCWSDGIGSIFNRIVTSILSEKGGKKALVFFLTRSKKEEFFFSILSEKGGKKSAAKKSGDAWRVLMDSCLPVLHLIDTRRSIPYSVKQVEELLGIAPTFEPSHLI